MVDDPPRDATHYSYTWTGASPTEDVEHKRFEKQLTVISDDQRRRDIVANMRLDPSVLFNLKCRMWRFTELVAPGKLGQPIKVFTCETDNTRIVPGRPSASGPRPATDLPSAGATGGGWGVRDKTGRRGRACQAGCT